MSFWGELKRRNVFKVGAAYVIVAWLIVQVANTFFPILHLPQWTVTFIAALLILGLPVALILAWAYELTPEGVKLTKKVPLADSITHVTGRKLNYVLGGLLVVSVALLLFDNYYLDRCVVESETATSVAEQTPAVSEVEEAPKTIAVLPFENLSSDPEQEYFVDGLTEEVLNSLAQISDLTVIARTSSFTFKGSNKKIQEIADELGVAHILEGSVRKAGNDLRITAQLIKGSDGSHLWAKNYDRELKDIFAVQEDIATAVADELKVTLGIGKSFRQLGGTDNEEAYEYYLVSQGLWDRTMGGDNVYTLIQRALESIDAAIAIDENFALAWSRKAVLHGYLTIFGPAGSVELEREAGLNAAEKTIELEPDLADGYFSMGFCKTNQGRWVDAKSAYDKAFQLKTEPLSGAEVHVATHYGALGYNKKEKEILEEMLRSDPLNLEVRGFYLNCFAILGDKERVEEEYQRGKSLIRGPWLWGDAGVPFFCLGDNDVMSREDILYSDPIFDAAKEHLDSPQEGLSELRRLSAADDTLSTWNLIAISLWAAYFDDTAFAMDMLERALSVDLSSGFFLWWPTFKEVRQTPRFKEYIYEIGLVDYWNQFSWPDLCRPLDNGDFECD